MLGQDRACKVHASIAISLSWHAYGTTGWWVAMSEDAMLSAFHPPAASQTATALEHRDEDAEGLPQTALEGQHQTATGGQEQRAFGAQTQTAYAGHLMAVPAALRQKAPAGQPQTDLEGGATASPGGQHQTTFKGHLQSAPAGQFAAALSKCLVPVKVQVLGKGVANAEAAILVASSPNGTQHVGPEPHSVAENISTRTKPYLFLPADQQPKLCTDSKRQAPSGTASARPDDAQIGSDAEKMPDRDTAVSDDQIMEVQSVHQALH